MLLLGLLWIPLLWWRLYQRVCLEEYHSHSQLAPVCLNVKASCVIVLVSKAWSGYEYVKQLVHCCCISLSPNNDTANFTAISSCFLCAECLDVLAPSCDSECIVVWYPILVEQSNEFLDHVFKCVGCLVGAKFFLCCLHLWLCRYISISLNFHTEKFGALWEELTSFKFDGDSVMLECFQNNFKVFLQYGLLVYWVS